MLSNYSGRSSFARARCGLTEALPRKLSYVAIPELRFLEPLHPFNRRALRAICYLRWNAIMLGGRRNHEAGVFDAGECCSVPCDRLESSVFAAFG